jgi:ZIP family zinc transporter
MGEAFFWGAVAGGALLLGALIAIRRPVAERTLGSVMALGAGVLMSAVAYDLVQEASVTSERGWIVAAGLAAGALVFYGGDAVIDGAGGEHRKRSSGQQAEGSPMAIVLGAVLDGIPESIVLGVGLLAGEGVSAAFIVAVFLSNLPEGLAATSGLLTAGWTRARVLRMWAAVVAVSALAALVGFAVFDAAGPSTIAFVLAFAGGAVLTMLADTMMPEAFEHEGKLVGLFTTAGFALAFSIHVIA